jgi:phospholipid/cholesterol/gamma-HCH transport system ATP-binding protein
VSAPLIQAQSVTRSFGDQVVLDSVDFELHPGERVAIVGPSGTGKSVLLRHLVGLLTPDDGTVRVGGVDLAEMTADELRQTRRRFGMLFQGGALFDSLTLAENVAFPLRRVARMAEAEVRSRVAECLDAVRLADAASLLPGALSGGMRKRAALARCIALEPEILLFDEPTSGLDPDTALAIDELIVGLTRDLGAAAVVVTHDIQSVLRVADRVVFLHQGRVHWSGDVSHLARADDPFVAHFIRAGAYAFPPLL